MNYGAIIIRFKYLSRNNSLPPEEKVVSYHVSISKKNTFWGFVQGYKTFRCTTFGDKGNHMLTPIYLEYENAIIR